MAEIGATAKLGEVLTRMGCKRAMMVTDKGVRKMGLLEEGIASLRTSGVDMTIFDDVTNDPPEETVKIAVSHAINAGVDCVVGFGGGSPMDVAKLVAYLAHKHDHQSLDSLYGVANATKSERLPLVQIPTTAGTGSEVTPIRLTAAAAAAVVVIVIVVVVVCSSNNSSSSSSSRAE